MWHSAEMLIKQDGELASLVISFVISFCISSTVTVQAWVDAAQRYMNAGARSHVF